MRILFDVGANHGTDSIPIIRNNKDMICCAFEPTPQLISYLTEQTKDIQDRYHIFPYAVSDYVGESEFNVAGNADWGCSSLLKFADNLRSTWPGRRDFNVTEKIKVNVITLEYFIEKLCSIDIPKIDFFHCDTQGSDLKVLKGFGKYINLINKGVVEAAYKKDILYHDQNFYIDTIEYLVKNNFAIVSVKPNDDRSNEVNISFENKKYENI